MDDKMKEMGNENLQESEIGNEDLGKVAGGGIITGYCFRCGEDVPFAKGTIFRGLKYYGKPVCQSCFDYCSEVERKTGKPYFGNQ